MLYYTRQRFSYGWHLRSPLLLTLINISTSPSCPPNSHLVGKVLAQPIPKMSQSSASPLVDASKENTTTVHIQRDPPRLSDASSSAAPVTPKKLLTAVERRKAFRERVGIDPNGTTLTEAAKASPKHKMKFFILMLRGLAHSLSFFPRMPLPPSIGKQKQKRTTRLTIHFSFSVDTKPDHQFRAGVEKAYQDQKRYYRIVASASHGLLWLALASNRHRCNIDSTGPDEQQRRTYRNHRLRSRQHHHRRLPDILEEPQPAESSTAV